MKKQYEMKLNGWRADGIVLNPINEDKSKVLDLIEDNDDVRVTLTVEYHEPKTIQMTESDFKDIIKIVETWDNPVAELKSRLKHGKYDVR